MRSICHVGRYVDHTKGLRFLHLQRGPFERTSGEHFESLQWSFFTALIQKLSQDVSVSNGTKVANTCCAYFK